MCPYDKDEHCKYERYFGEPMFSKCENCEIKIGAVIKQRKMKEEHRIDCCGKWVSYKDYIKELEQKLETERSSRIALVNKIAELEAQIKKMKAELHHRLVSPSHDDSDCLDKIIGLDRLWQFGQEF